MDRGTRQTTVHSIALSQTQMKPLSTHAHRFIDIDFIYRYVYL